MDSPTDRPAYEPEVAGSFPIEPQAKLSASQRLTKVFFSPGEVFEDIKTKPTWVVALIAYVLVVTLTSLVVWNNIDYEASTRQAIESFGFEVPEEVLDQQIESAERTWFIKPILTGVVFVPILLVIAATLFFLMMKMVGSDIGFLATYSTMLHAYFPGKAVYSVLLAILAVTQGPVTEMGLVTLLKSSVAGFLPEGSSMVAVTIGSFFDAFRIWGVVLLVIGLSIVGGVNRAKSTFAALVPWIIAIVISAGLAFLPSLFTS
jgi:hypothetical protein